MNNDEEVFVMAAFSPLLEDAAAVGADDVASAVVFLDSRVLT